MTTKTILRVTPLLIIAAVTLFIMLYELFFKTNISSDFRYPLIRRQFFFLGEIVVLDIIIKLTSRKNTRLLWVLQSIACIALLYYWIVS